MAHPTTDQLPPRDQPAARRGPEPPDLAEKGGMKDGQPQRLDRRLFMQFMAFGGFTQETRLLGDALDAAGVSGVVYADVNDPRGLGLLTFSHDPDFFLDAVRPLLNRQPFASLVQKPEYTMLGRTYALGYEPDLADVLLHRPRRTVLNPQWKWAVWYPLRRSGKFAELPADEQRVILAEHGAIGMSYGAGDYAHDVRLGVPRPRQERQRLRRRPDRQRPVPAVGARADDEEDAADVALPRTPRSVLRRPRHLPERDVTTLNAEHAEHAEDLQEMISASSAGSAFNVVTRSQWVRTPVDAGASWPARTRTRDDERRFAPGAAEERDADRQPAHVSHRHGDMRIAGH